MFPPIEVRRRTIAVERHTTDDRGLAVGLSQITYVGKGRTIASMARPLGETPDLEVVAVKGTGALGGPAALPRTHLGAGVSGWFEVRLKSLQHGGSQPCPMHYGGQFGYKALGITSRPFVDAAS